MQTAVYMTLVCAVSATVFATVVVPQARVEVLLGMIAPLAVAVTTMVAVRRTFTRDPEQLTPLMVKAFGMKMLLFGAYVAVVLGLSRLDPVPFVASFTAYFIALHLTEAMWLRTLFGTPTT